MTSCLTLGSEFPCLIFSLIWNSSILSHSSSLWIFCLTRRRRWRGGERWGAAALLLRLHHALPHCFLEGPVRLCPTDWVLERLGLLHCLHITDRCPHCTHWWSGVTLWLHDRIEGLCDSCGVCGAGDIRARWGSKGGDADIISVILPLWQDVWWWNP